MACAPGQHPSRDRCRAAGCQLARPRTHAWATARRRQADTARTACPRPAAERWHPPAPEPAHSIESASSHALAAYVARYMRKAHGLTALVSHLLGRRGGRRLLRSAPSKQDLFVLHHCLALGVRHLHGSIGRGLWRKQKRLREVCHPALDAGWHPSRFERCPTRTHTHTHTASASTPA